MNRLEQLRQFAAEEPHDPFNHYALALEYLKTNPREAENLFEQLLQQHPEYLPTYYPYAQRLAETKNYDAATAIFDRGIDQARKAGDAKTLRELQSAKSDMENDL
ncbi:MAG: tetratricopeptide repeat protein [Cyclobacteriaceae bacterium]|nr:tetratricopeptide repeat protein [Cyclobacteriaceae bacterium]